VVEPPSPKDQSYEAMVPNCTVEAEASKVVPVPAGAT
jgi:hypothetical protein